MVDKVEQYAQRTAPYLDTRKAKEEWYLEAMETAAYFARRHRARCTALK